MCALICLKDIIYCVSGKCKNQSAHCLHENKNRHSYVQINQRLCRETSQCGESYPSGIWKRQNKRCEYLNQETVSKEMKPQQKQSKNKTKAVVVILLTKITQIQLCMFGVLSVK